MPVRRRAHIPIIVQAVMARLVRHIHLLPRRQLIRNPDHLRRRAPALHHLKIPLPLLQANQGVRPLSLSQP